MEQKTTPEQFREMMKRISKQCYDIEVAHVDMDTLMMSVLIELGYKDGVEIFDQQEKWYA